MSLELDKVVLGACEMVEEVADARTSPVEVELASLGVKPTPPKANKASAGMCVCVMPLSSVITLILITTSMTYFHDITFIQPIQLYTNNHLP